MPDHLSQTVEHRMQRLVLVAFKRGETFVLGPDPGRLIDRELLDTVDAWRGKGRPAFLATVQEHRRARYLMETLGLSRHFDAMLYSAELGAAKPDRRFFERAHARLPAASPDDVIFLDAYMPNVEAANAFGWRARHYAAVADLHTALAEA